MKDTYSATTKPEIVNIPLMKFVFIEGKGDPNQPDFGLATQALFSFSYAVKMSYKKPNPPKGYYEYKVFPLEGEWDLVDKSKPSTDKANYRYKIMIQQPTFLTKDLFDFFLAEIKNKKPNPKLDQLRFAEITEGLNCQMLHIGSYDNEPLSFLKMEEFCVGNQYRRLIKSHKEIYLSDPRKADPVKMRTILRFKV